MIRRIELNDGGHLKKRMEIVDTGGTYLKVKLKWRESQYAEFHLRRGDLPALLYFLKGART